MQRVGAYRCQGTDTVQRRGQRSVATWRLAILPALIILAALSGCGATGALGGANLAMSPTPTLPAARPLIWSVAHSPVAQLSPLSNGYFRNGAVAVPAPSDSDVAYACTPRPEPAAADVLTWVTRDRGAHWDATAGITISASYPVEVTSCGIVVDVSADATAMAQIGFMQAGKSAGECVAGSCTNYALFVTTDMGQQWLPLTPPRGPSSPSPYGQSPPLDTIYELATYQQTTYGLFEPTPEDLSELAGGVFMSRDHLRTWTLVPGLPYRIGQDPTEYRVAEFWLNPVTGAMLAMGANNMAGSKETFLTSDDPGSNWTTLTVPPFVSTSYNITVQQPYTGQPWRICAGNANYIGTGETPNEDSLVCTGDGGTHWTTTEMDQPFNPPGSGPGTGPGYTLVGIADDGAVLLMTASDLERVIPGLTGAQSLGPAPNLGIMTYVDGGGAGSLWSTAGSNSTSASPGRIYTARYV